MKTPDIPNIKGVVQMSPLEMNRVRFNKKHTVLTPALLASIGSSNGTSAPVRKS